MLQSDRPELWVIAGPNGAGKTTLVRALRAAWRVPEIYLNPDEYAQNELGDWNDPIKQLAAANAVAAERERLLGSGLPFAFETVFSGADKLDFVRRAQAVGYFVRFCFIALAGPELHAARVALRVLDGGHDVPIAKIIKRYEASIRQAALAARFVDRGYFVDNSAEGIAGLQPLFRTRDGEVAKRYVVELPPWSELIARSLDREGVLDHLPVSRSTLKLA